MVGHMELTSVASSGNVMITNAAVSPRGRLFGNFPRWTDVPTPSVGEATADGGFTPFPGGTWNEWQPSLSPDERFVCTHGLHADRDNNLWVIDDASPHHGKTVEGGAKLVQIDLETNRVRRIYALGPDLAPPGAVLSHLRVDPRFLYVTDSGFGVIVVIDRLRIPPVTGITSDAAGALYFSALTEDGVLKMGADRKLQTVIRDDRISGANEGSIGPDGCYYFPNSQVPRVNRPYEVFRIELS